MLYSKGWTVTSVNDNMEILESIYIAVENVKWCSKFGNSMLFFQKLNLELPYYPIIPLLGIDPRELKCMFVQKLCTQLYNNSIIHSSQKVETTYIISMQWNIIEP